MTKNSFILYSELLTGDHLVGCIYFASNECRAQPFVQVAQGERDYYKPTEQDQKEHCRSGGSFRRCPRLLAYQDHLKAIGLEKERVEHS